MSEATTSVSNQKYLEILRRFDATYPPAGIQESIKRAKGKLKKPIIVGEEEEESSDCDSERYKVLKTTVDSLVENIKRLSEVRNRKHTSSTFTEEQMQHNEANREDPVEKRVPNNTEMDDDDSSSENDIFIDLANPNPHTAHSRADDPPEVELRITAQYIPTLSTDNESSTLRNLLINPIPKPEKSELKHYKKQMIASTTDGAPIDLSYFPGTANLTPPRPSNLEAQTHSGSNEKQIPATLETNPQIQLNNPGYSGGHFTYQAHSENEDKRQSTVQRTNLATQSRQLVSQSYVVQEPQDSYERFTVMSHNPRPYPHNVIKTTATNAQSYPNLQQYHQHNIGPTPNQPFPHPGNIYPPDSQPLVAQSFTEKQLVVHQFYPQNNESYTPNNSGPYLQTPLQYSSSLVPPQEYFPTPPVQSSIQQTEDLKVLRYWANFGKNAHRSMTKSATCYPTEYLVTNQQIFQVASSGQVMQGLQETSAANTEEISKSVVHENAERSQSVIQNTLHVEDQLSTPVRNIREQHLSSVIEIDSDSAPRILDIPIESPNDIELNTNFATDRITNQVSGYAEESANPGHAKALILQLHDLLEDLKFTENTIIMKLKNKSCFDHSEIVNMVKKSVNDYCAEGIINVSASTSGPTNVSASTSGWKNVSASTSGPKNVSPSTSKVAVVKIRRLKHSDYISDSSDDEDEDYVANTDEEEDSDREPIRKRIRTAAFVLPEEYDPDDSMWTLRYRGPGPGLVEIMPDSGIYANERRVTECKRVARSSNALARLLLAEVFSYSALTVCSLTGKPSRYHSEGNSRPGLDKNAIEVLMALIEQVAECKKTWPRMSKNKVLNSMRWKLTKMKRSATA